MKRIFKRLAVIALSLAVLMTGQIFPAVSAQESDTQAEDITGHGLFTEYTGFQYLDSLFDGNLVWGKKVSAPASLTMSSETGIGSIYIRFAVFYGDYILRDPEKGTEHVWQQKYLHDFIDLEALFGYIPNTVELVFDHDDLTINELSVFSPGEVPADVQRWSDPVEGQTDLIVFSTHGDDEHLFFAGILPYYAGQRQYQVQLVYLTDHHNNDGITRMREMLDGLWAAGITTYPVWGEFEDFYRWGIDNTYTAFESQGVTREDLIEFVARQIRRFKPKVVVGHDFNGEYDNGQHMVYADVLAAALERTMDPTQFPESAESYGTWDVPKAYFHLYKENPVVMDWDQPLDHFGGKTAWQISKAALQKHTSQLPALEKTDWYFGETWYAAYIGKYSPCRFGLYRSTVGEDVEKNDFFENVTSHAQDAEIAEAQRLAEEEEARLKAEEEARLQAEEEARRASEEAARQESIARETTLPQPTEPAGEETSVTALLLHFWYVPAAAAILLIVGLLLLRKGTKKYK